MQVSQLSANIWDRILGLLESKVNPQSFTTWLRPTRLARDEGKKILVAVPSELFATWLTKNYLGAILDCAGELGRSGVEISFVFDEHAQVLPTPGILEPVDGAQRYPS